MSYLNREGTFLAVLTDAGVKESESGAVMCNLLFDVYSQWNGQEWEECDNAEVRGSLCLIKKDGDYMEDNAQRLVDVLGWDGVLDSLQDGSMKGLTCQIDVKSEDYNGRRYYKADRIKPADAIPGGSVEKLEDDRLKQLEAKHGGFFRSLAKPVAGRPAPPRRPVPTAPVATPSDFGSDNSTQDDIPF